MVDGKVGKLFTLARKDSGVGREGSVDSKELVTRRTPSSIEDGRRFLCFHCEIISFFFFFFLLLKE